MNPDPISKACTHLREHALAVLAAVLEALQQERGHVTCMAS